MRKICTIALFLFLIFPASANADLVAFLDFESQTDDQSGNGVAVSGAISGFVAGHEGLGPAALTASMTSSTCRWTSARALCQK